MKNNKFMTLVSLVFDTRYGAVALWLLLELVLKLIKELLFRSPLPPNHPVLDVAYGIHFVQLYLPAIILVSVVVSFVRRKPLRAVGQLFMAILSFVLYLLVVAVTTKTETVCIDISTGSSLTESSARAEKTKQSRKERIERMRKKIASPKVL